MVDYPIFLSFWVVDSLVIYSFSILFPGHVELGTHRLNLLQSIIFSGFWVNFLFWAFWDFFKARKLGIQSVLLALMFITGLNAVSIWMVARFAGVTGFGIANYFWAIIIGATATFFQLFVWSGEKK